MAERVFATWHAARNAPKLFEGVEPMLRRLKERVKLGVLATPQFHVKKKHIHYLMIKNDNFKYIINLIIYDY